MGNVTQFRGKGTANLVTYFAVFSVEVVKNEPKLETRISVLAPSSLYAQGWFDAIVREVYDTDHYKMYNNADELIYDSEA